MIDNVNICLYMSEGDIDKMAFIYSFANYAHKVYTTIVPIAGWWRKHWFMPFPTALNQLKKKNKKKKTASFRIWTHVADSIPYNKELG